MKQISSIIKNEVEAYKNSSIDIVDNYLFNQYDTLGKIMLYANDRFWECDDEDAIFWNLTKTRLPHFIKNIDLDTKDLMPYGVGETNYFQAWVLKVKLQEWLEKDRMALKLNTLAHQVSLYGSAIWKLSKKNGKKTVETVNLRNIYFDPTVPTIKDSSFIDELHLMEESQIRAKAGTWDNVDKVFENAVQHEKTEDIDQPGQDYTDVKYYEVWERWGEVPIEKDNGETDYKYKHYIVCGEGRKETILFEEDADPDKLPYYDFHIGEFEGRWLRIGVCERLFKLQNRVNRLVNQNAETTEIASMLLFRTQDPNTEGNLLKSLQSGDIINSADMQQLPIDNRAIGGFLNEMALIEQQANDLCMTPQVIRGETLPSGTPFRSLATIMNAGKSTFRFIKEGVGETVGYILKEKILPGIASEWNKGEIIEIAGNIEDIRFYDSVVILMKRAELLQEAIDVGRFVSDAELASFEARIRADIERKGRKVKTGKNFFNFDYGIKMNVTGESVDKAQRNDAFSNILQWVQANPAIQNNVYFRQYVEENGITPIRMSNEEVQELETSGATPQQPKGDALMAQVDSN